MSRKVIIDCDPGIDAALALTLALFDPSLEVVAITAVQGRVSAEQSTLNVQCVIEQLDAPRLPRVGAARTLSSSSPFVDGRKMHGDDGLGNAGLPTSKLHHQHQSDKLISDTIRSAPDDVTLICLGPLTNVAAAFQRDPELPGMIDRMILSGGTVKAPGNVTATSEFNVYCDVESAQTVFRSPVTKALVPLDVTQIPFNLDLLEQLPSVSTRVGRFLKGILPYLYRSYHQRLGLEHIYLESVVAILMAIDPTLFETKEFHGEVETTGNLAQGMTVFDRRPNAKQLPNIEVAVRADVDQIRNRTISGLRRAIS